MTAGATRPAKSDSIPGRPSRRRFGLLAAGLGALATAAVLVAATPGGLRLAHDPAEFWLFAAFVLIGDLLPIRVPRGTHVEEITVSSAFALAVLLVFGAGPAVAAYAVAAIVTDLVNRTAPDKMLFNTSQAVLSMSAAAGVLALLGHPAPVDSIGSELPAVLAAIVTLSVVDNVLVAVAFRLLEGRGRPRQPRSDAIFGAYVDGFLLSLAPVIVAAAGESLWLVPLLFCPMLAIVFGGRQAVTNAHRALHDDLTELPNRALLHGTLEEWIGAGTSAAVLLIDLRDFRAVNDTLGHNRGDELLQQVAERLERSREPGDLLARAGGDEFALLRPARLDPEAAGALAKRIAGVLAAPFEIGGLSLEVRARIGIAWSPDHGSAAKELIQHADVALDHAKGDVTVYAIYEEEQDGYSVDRLVLAGQLGRGIRSGELVLEYQPKLPLRDGLPDGVEALVRWQHPQLGLIGPGAFVPLAEHTGLISALTDTVLESALAQCAAWRSDGLDLRVAVNLTAHDLLDPELPGRVERLLERWHLPGSSLEVEITESQAMTEVDGARDVLRRLHELGVPCAIDDFGTGYSSLAQLQQLEVEEIKIDRSFVMAMDASGDETIVRSTIDLAHNLGMTVTAEGVETEAVYRRVAALGCDFVQGYHLGHPMRGEVCARAMRRFAREGATRA